MNAEMIRSEEELTREGDLADWETFCIAYYEPILRVLRLLRVPESDVLDQAHAFLQKAADRDFLKSFRAHRERAGQEGRQVQFRKYLYRSLQYHVLDSHRSRQGKASGQMVGTDQATLIAARNDPALDPDALYALDVLHQAIQALRSHCERLGKPHLWTIFEATHLASEFRGRPAKTRAELLRDFPGKDSSFLDNSLTTAKRAFRRIILDVIPRSFRDGVSPSERFVEWMEILERSNASQFDRLQLAYRVAPFIAIDESQAPSVDLSTSRQEARRWVFSDDDGSPADDEEMSILLSFRMALPLTEMVDAAELRRYIAPSSVFWPTGRDRSAPGLSHSTAQSTRPICLLTLLDPTPEEKAALAEVDMPGLLASIKSYAKQLHLRTDHTLPPIFAPLFYTICSVLAMTRHGVSLHSIDHASLIRNAESFLDLPWIDEPLRSLFRAAISFDSMRSHDSPART